MSDAKQNLWGDIESELEDPSAGNPIVATLEAQARELAELSRGRITAMVTPVHPDSGPAGWEFRLVAPLAHYRYALFRVEQHALDFPATLYQYRGGEPKAWPCADQAAFEAALGQVLKSPETRKAIANIAALDRLQGRQAVPFDFDEPDGRARAGTLTVEALPDRTFDGEWRTATVTTAAGIALRVRFKVSGTVMATLGTDEQTRRIAGAVDALLARGMRFDPEGETPTVELSTKGANLIGEGGELIGLS